MKIQWITRDNVGGSFLTDKRLIEYAEENYKIEFPQLGFKPSTNVDLIVVSNIHGMEETVFNAIARPFVKIEHDYGFCKYRDAMCEYHECSQCTLDKLYNFFNKKSLLNYYMSPIQYGVHTKCLGEVIPNVRFIQSQVDVDTLLALQSAKEKGYTIAPVALKYHKGIENVLKWSEE